MYAEKIVATYTMSGTKRNVEAGIDSEGALNVFIQVVGEYSEYVMIRVSGEEDIKTFITQLTYCKNKFIEWEQVAKHNNVSDFKKEIDARFPNVEVWWVGLEWYSSYEKNFIKPLFVVNDGDAAFGTYGLATHWANEFIDQEFYMLFETAYEIQSLINALDITKIKSVLNRDAQTSALFQ
jgi:muconolactone delta-isomerase